MTTKDFVVFDGDSHVVEPPALWEKYLEPNTARSASTRCSARKATPAPVSRLMAKSFATMATPICRGMRCGGPA